MKTILRNHVKLSFFTTVASFLLIFQSSAQQLKEVMNPPQIGTFWLLSFQLGDEQSPPFPFDPYGGLMPVYEMKGFPGQYVVADSPEDYQQLKAANETSRTLRMNALEDDGPPVPGEGSSGGGGGGAISYSPMVFTNAPEELLFDTLNSSSNGILASWRDVRTSPVPDGMALGIIIATNCPFELTRISAEVILENPEALADTEFEVGYFHNTNKFSIGMYEDPEYIASDVAGTLSKTLTDLGNGRWLLSLELPTYEWGTNRVLTIRTVPNSNGTMTKMSFIACSDTIPGVRAYASDNTTTNLVQVHLPKIRVWRRMISPVRSPSFEWASVVNEANINWLPGYQLGTATNLALPIDWQTEGTLRTAIVDTDEGMGFFISRPDPTE